MLSVIFSFCYAECRFAMCRYAKCRYAKCRYAECHYAECRGALGITMQGVCRCAECCAERHNAACCFAESIDNSNTNWSLLSHSY
jgi:hypothetical protein